MTPARPLNCLRAFKRFGADDTGAVTVDWVVLTAAIVALAAGATMVALPGISQLAARIGTTTETLQVGFDQFAGPGLDAQSDPLVP